MLLVVLVAQLTFAQERSVSGIVSDNAGMPLPGVSVLIKGTKTGTQSDFDGKYSIKAEPSAILVFSYVGMKTNEKSASSTTLNVKLSSDATQLENVVVTTAFGIKRNSKKLGYSVSSVKASQLTETSEPDLARNLAGKVAGVNVNISTGVAGAANQITIRGVNSLIGNTDPLIIVDGVAFSNASVTTSSQISGGGGYESALSSLDPNDIADVSVLKSTAAAALYGSRAMNGVIVITTKSGSSKISKAEKLSVNVGLGSYLEEISNLPVYQNTYGAGSNFNYSGTSNGSWGPRFDKLATVPTWPTLLAAFPTEFGATVPYVAKPNNVKDLFKTGMYLDRTLGFNYTGQDGNFSGTFSDLAQDGYIPYNTYDRTSMSVGGNFKLNQKLTVGANMSYSQTKQVGGFFGEQQFSGASSSFARTLFLARNWDLNLPYTDPTTGGSVTPNGTQFDHPLWSWEHDQIITKTDRTVAGVNANYKIDDNISASYRIGLNKYTLGRKQIRDIASRANSGLGDLVYDNFTNEDIESTFLLNFNYKLSESLDLTAIVGNNILQNNSTRLAVEGKELIIPNIFTLKNTKSLVSLGDDKYQKRNVGVFVDATLSFKNYLFLNATARNDWSSSLPKNNNSYFYPSVSSSLIVTDAFDIKNDILTFAKIRGSYAKVGRDNDAEFLKIAYNQGQLYNNNPTVSNSTTLGDQAVNPEFSREYEIGTDLEFFKKRISIDLTYYDKLTTDLITDVTVPSTTGYSILRTNAGSISNKGVELGLTLVPVVTDNFRWTLNTIFSKNTNEVKTLKEGLDRIQLNANAVAYAIPGEAFGVFYGTKFARDANGNYLINRTGGGIIQDPKLGVIGDPNADFKVSFVNTFVYKAFSLRSQFDWKQGGDISSSTINTLLGRGVTKDTEDREHSFIIPGYYGNNDGTPVLDASGNQIPNATQLSMNELYFSPAGGNTFGINSVNEASIYDGTVFRLREVSLTYDVPAKTLQKTPFGKISLSAIGSNIWFFAPNVPKYTNFDPETTSYGKSNLQGIETSAAPTSKRFGLKLNLSF